MSSTNLNVLGSHSLQKLDVFFRVEPGHVVGGGNVGPEDLHLLVEAVVQDQGVGDTETMRLHWVARAVVEAPDVGVVKVDNLLLGTHFRVFLSLPEQLGQGRSSKKTLRIIFFSETQIQKASD